MEDLALLVRVLAGPDGSDPSAVPGPVDAAPGVAGTRVAFYTEDGISSATKETAAGLRADVRGVGVLRREMPSARLYALLRRWDSYRRDMLRFLGSFDAIVCPVYPCPAPAHGGTRAPEVVHGLSYTTPYSLTGWPCAVVTCGWTDGLPIGVQIVTGPWKDMHAISLAAQIEGARGGWKPSPT